MLARRFAQNEISEPPYEPQGVPACSRDLTDGSVVFRPTREQWLGALGELVQITNEAVRRRSVRKRDAAKPLSLEYMADRLDVDDPLFGYMVLTRDESWLQGFVTCTTFTTWHRHFRWDSGHPCLGMLEEEDDEESARMPHCLEPNERAGRHVENPQGGAATDADGGAAARGGAAAAPNGNGIEAKAHRVIDADGSLAVELQAELHAGDPESEGIVWPRIAELSLLGGLGCGSWLLRLIIDGLEAPDSPYRWLVCQATDNSVPFYEKMGFVRVGAVCQIAPKKSKANHKMDKMDKAPEVKKDKSADDDEDDPEWGPSEKGAKGGTKAQEGAKTRGGSKPQKSAKGKKGAKAQKGGAKGLKLLVASETADGEMVEIKSQTEKQAEKQTEKQAAKKRKASAPPPLPVEVVSSHCWHVTDSFETVAEVAEQHGVDVFDVIFLNQRRYPGLSASAVLKKKTKLAVPTPQSAAAIRQMLAADRQQWHVVEEDGPVRREAARAGVDAATVIELNKDRLKGLSLSAVLLKGTRLLVRGSSVEYEEYCHWTYPGDDNSNNCASYMMARKLKPLQERAPPADDSIIERTRPLVLEERPEPHASGKRKSFVERSRSRAEEGEGAAPRTTPRELFNRVVTIEGEDGEDGKSPYFYVLTYLPDLQWCHVAPLQQVGTFEEGDIAGRPKFMLVPEEDAVEMDVGAARCTVMKAIEVKGTKENADEEEWDIYGPADEDFVPVSAVKAANLLKPKLALPVAQLAIVKPRTPTPESAPPALGAEWGATISVPPPAAPSGAPTNLTPSTATLKETPAHALNEQPPPVSGLEPNLVPSIF